MVEDSDAPISTEVTSAQLNITPATWATWRCKGKGPKYLKIGRNVFSRPSWVAEFLATLERDPADRLAARKAEPPRAIRRRHSAGAGM